MKEIQLARLPQETEDSIHNHPDFMESMMTENWDLLAELVHRVVGKTLSIEPISIDQLHWGGYFVINRATHEVVGSCAFKSEPSAAGSVEIAYFTYPGFEGEGYATEMAKKLIELASSSTDVKKIIAHTLPQKNASTRVLEKSGLKFVGEIKDPDDGTIWQWKKDLST